MGTGAPVLTGGVRARAGREGAARGGGPSVLLRRVVCACAAAFLKAEGRFVPPCRKARAHENTGRTSVLRCRRCARATETHSHTRRLPARLHTGLQPTTLVLLRQALCAAVSALSRPVSLSPPMVKNNYSSGRNDDRIANPNGKNEAQEFVADEEEGPHEKDVLPCHSYSAVGNMNMNSMLVENIRSHEYFKGLSEMKTFEEVVDQVYYDCKITPLWTPGTHKAQKAAGMCSGLRGVRRAPARPAVPSARPTPLAPIASQPAS